MSEFDKLKYRLREFARDRNWEGFHSPKNLAMAMSVEAAELVEHFQWLSEQQSYQLDEEKRRKVAMEIADVMIYLVRIADQLDIDVTDAINKKIHLNALKYPS